MVLTGHIVIPMQLGADIVAVLINIQWWLKTQYAT